jgi:hypothetical protein
MGDWSGGGSVLKGGSRGGLRQPPKGLPLCLTQISSPADAVATYRFFKKKVLVATNLKRIQSDGTPKELCCGVSSTASPRTFHLIPPQHLQIQKSKVFFFRSCR